jgi:polyisoprenoid-binding protein YceI
MRSGHATTVLALWAASLGWTGTASAQKRPIDTGKSTMTIRVSKAGMLSAFGHNHEIAAPIARGEVDTAARQVELHTMAAALEVRDPDLSEQDRSQVRSTMLGDQVLDAPRYPEIIFRSSSVAAAGAGAFTVQGQLTVRGQTRPVTVQVRETDGHYVGTAEFKQSEFGIQPVKAAGGTIRVKDEIRIEFDIQLAR